MIRGFLKLAERSPTYPISIGASLHLEPPWRPPLLSAVRIARGREIRVWWRRRRAAAAIGLVARGRWDTHGGGGRGSQGPTRATGGCGCQLLQFRCALLLFLLLTLLDELLRRLEVLESDSLRGTPGFADPLGVGLPLGLWLFIPNGRHKWSAGEQTVQWEGKISIGEVSNREVRSVLLGIHTLWAGYAKSKGADRRQIN